jgi:hypothetical protein
MEEFNDTHLLCTHFHVRLQIAPWLLSVARQQNLRAIRRKVQPVAPYPQHPPLTSWANIMKLEALLSERLYMLYMQCLCISFCILYMYIVNVCCLCIAVLCWHMHWSSRPNNVLFTVSGKSKVIPPLHEGGPISLWLLKKTTSYRIELHTLMTSFF